MSLARILSDVSRAVSTIAGASVSEKILPSDPDPVEETLNSLILSCMTCPDTLEQDIFIMAAVALSVFHSDGNFSAEEEKMVDEFLSGLDSGSFSPSLSEKIRNIKLNPPCFSETMELVKTLPRDKWPVIDRIINISVRADSVITEQEIEYLRIWNTIYSSD